MQLLDRVRGRTKREIEVLVAEMGPKPEDKGRLDQKSLAPLLDVVGYG